MHMICLVKRHAILSNEILLKYPGSTIVSLAGSPALFVHLFDSRIPTKSAREVIFEDTQSSVSGGIPFGTTDEFFRVNLTGYSGELAEFANRLAGFKKYQANDFLVTSKNVCTQIKVTGSKKQKTLYVANPNDCLIKANAKHGPITIVLPDFIDYNASNIMTIKKQTNPIIKYK